MSENNRSKIINLVANIISAFLGALAGFFGSN